MEWWPNQLHSQPPDALSTAMAAAASSSSSQPYRKYVGRIGARFAQLVSTQPAPDIDGDNATNPAPTHPQKPQQPLATDDTAQMPEPEPMTADDTAHMPEPEPMTNALAHEPHDNADHTHWPSLWEPVTLVAAVVAADAEVAAHGCSSDASRSALAAADWLHWNISLDQQPPMTSPYRRTHRRHQGPPRPRIMPQMLPTSMHVPPPFRMELHEQLELGRAKLAAYRISVATRKWMDGYDDFDDSDSE